MTGDTSLTAHLREVLTGFWNEQFRVETTPGGLVAAMPMMNAAGWQVVVHLEKLTGNLWRISDHGETLGGLDDSGRHPDSGKTRESVELQCRYYGLARDGLNLVKVLRCPFDPVEIQIFVEGLVALSQLAPKRQTDAGLSLLHRMETRVVEFFEGRQWPTQRRHKLVGQVESEIVVEFYASARRPIALQPVGRNRQLRGYMEQWGWRWTDLGRAHPELIKAMVFDPDNQEWDPTSRRIGEKACDVFVPYTEIDEALDAAVGV